MKNLTTHEIAKLQATHENYTLDQALDAIYWLYYVQDVIDLDEEVQEAITRLQSLCSKSGINAYTTNKHLPEGNLAMIRHLFNVAKTNGLQYPKIRLDTGFETLPIVLQQNSQGVINITNGRAFRAPDNVWFGRIQTNGQLQFKHSLPNNEKDYIEEQLKLFNDNPPAYAKLYGHKTGNCMYCGRRLDNAQSVNAGYGPICAEKFGLPWGHLNLSGKQNEMEIATHE